MRIGSFYTIILPLKPCSSNPCITDRNFWRYWRLSSRTHTSRWAVVTIATVGYGDYYPVTTVGRIIAVFVMLSGIGIFVLLVDSLSQRRLQRTESKLKSKTQTGSLADEEKMVIRNKIHEIEKLIKEVHTLLGPN
jgi:voltage-gated potassium channel Kch